MKAIDFFVTFKVQQTILWLESFGKVVTDCAIMIVLVSTILGS